MAQHLQDSELLTAKPTLHNGQEMVIQGLGAQEHSDSSFSSQHLCSSQQSSHRNINLSQSSFKKISKSSSDLQNFSNKHAHICAHYNFLGRCPLEHCKKRHIFISEDDGLSELISDNIDLIDNLTSSGNKLKLPHSTYGTQLSKYRKCKSNTKEFCEKLEHKFITQEQIHFGDFPIQNFWNWNAFALQSFSIKSQPDLGNNPQENKYFSQLIKPKPLVDYKQASEILENSSSALNISNEIKKNLMSKLKSDIDKMQQKIKTISMLKKWINNQQVDQNEYKNLYSSLSQIQQIHYTNFLRITNISISNQAKFNNQFQNVEYVQQ
ncbi:unnamed protein product [Paramecium octaurelia]|uniref:C3H1-type domain-containing protein n=1 Tax=Paramecium octaurelia TaxID=43137 RepID=A0A8S1X5I1_PAROT|nr:unnamed protein product [Paramecium octaurelia]